MSTTDRTRPGFSRALGILALACPLLLNLPAHADPSPPAPYGRYRVSGVAAGDSLNVRKHSGAASATVGAIAPGTDGIMVSGAWEKIGDDTWWQIIPSPTNPVAGWVNGRYLARTRADRESDHNYPLACIGTEPFWSLEIDGGTARFGSAGSDEKRTWTASEWIAPQGSSLWTFAVRLNDGEAKGYAVIKEEDRDICTDNMSDVNYPFYLMLIDPAGGVFTGCCSRR